MKTRLALALFAATAFLATTSVAAASADPVSVQLEPAAATFAAGADAAFTVTVSGESASTYALHYSAEGGTVTGAVALNETGAELAQGTVFVRRDTPGDATLVAYLDGAEVARATTTFVEGAPLTVELTLVAGADAAARVWFFDVLDASGAERAFIQVPVSGDRPVLAVASQPLPYGDYTVRPTLGKDAAADCAGSAFFSMAPANGANVSVSATGAAAAFTVQLCGTASAPSVAPADNVSGAQGDNVPRPPATGTGKAPQLTEGQAAQLSRLLLGVCGLFVLGVCLTRLLAKVAPVKDPAKKKQ